MQKYKTKILTLLLSCIMASMMTVSSLAAKEPETRTPITTVTLTVSGRVVDGDESGYILATGTSDAYTIGNYIWAGGTAEGWTIGDKPKVQIYLHARGGYFFDKTTGTKKITINGAKYSTAKITDNKETLVITVELTPVSGDLGDPIGAEWAGYPVGKVSWDAVEKAGAYELILYKDDQQIFSVEKVSSVTYDFFPYMTKAGTYQFKVRAIPKTSEEAVYMTRGDWVYSDKYDLSDDETPGYRYDWNTNNTTGSKAPQQGWRNNNEGWWYQKADGSYPRNAWEQIDGKWYLFNNDGYMLTGWQSNNGKRFLLSDNGEMMRGWVQDSRWWYYLGNDGNVLTGWNNINGKWYYLNEEGKMLIGWWLLDGNWYYLNEPTGEKLTNTTVGGYYLNQDGIWKP